LMLLPLALAATGPWFRLRNLAINFLKDCMTQRYAILNAGMLAAMDRVGGKRVRELRVYARKCGS
jgi:hypothetical protein